MPELKEKMERVEGTYNEVKEYSEKIYKHIKHIETDKEFASHALNYKIKGILFSLRKGKIFEEIIFRWKNLIEMQESIVKPEKKKLLVMQGICGSGKSSWIREHELGHYTICPDTIRLLYAAPNPTISQANDPFVWKDVFRLLDVRMKNGDFTIIDAVHAQEKSLKKYKKLCEQYDYEFEIKRFDITLEEALERDNNREDYRKVPHDVIERMYNKLNMKDLNTQESQL